MLNKDEELGLFEIIKAHFPNLNGRSMVLSQNEFLAHANSLENYFCTDLTAKDRAAEYIKENIPYIVLDESEGYKCLFFKGTFLKVHYDVTNNKIIQLSEQIEK